MGTWTPEEEIVLVYYITRNITYASIIEIMTVRCGTGVRNIKQISEKVIKLRKHGVLEQKFQRFHRRNRDQNWDVKRADSWILNTMNKAELDILLDFSGFIAATIDETNDLGRFLNIMHINDGGKAYFPSRFNLYYEYQSLYHIDHLYQPQNTGGIDMGNKCTDDAGQVYWPSHVNQDYELPKLSPMRSPHHVDHLYQPENTGGMDMGTKGIDDAGQVYWPSHFNQDFELPKLSPVQSSHHLDHLYQPENTGGMDTGNQFVDDGGQAHWPSQVNQHYESQSYQSVYHLDRLYQHQVNQHYELPKLSPMVSPYHVDHLGLSTTSATSAT